jgi:hypothetical protein
VILASSLAQPSLAAIFTTIGTYLTALALIAGAIPLLIKMRSDANAAKVAAEAEQKARKKAEKAARRDARDAKLAAEAAHIAALAAQTTADATHDIVNSQRTEMRQHIADLTAALQAAGKPVPRDRSLDHPDPGGM